MATHTHMSPPAAAAVPAAPLLGGRSIAHWLALGLVWLTIASGAVVFSEPAPFDVLMIGLVLLLPLMRLARFTPGLIAMLGLWLVVAAAGLAASTASLDMAASIRHTLITLYLSLAGITIAAFVAQAPLRHTRLILSATLGAALIATAAAAAGYFGLAPGGLEDILTVYGRARGTFKDPNVFGPFLVPALLYAIHLWTARRALASPLRLAVILLLALGILISFSRGAWANMAIAMAVYGYLRFVTARTHRLRLKLFLLAFFGAIALGLTLLAALQSDTIRTLIAERAALTQSYDTGPEGRFGGQRKALSLIVEKPLGIGALQFSGRYHSEDVHNVYLSMFLNAGWIGGFLYVLIMAATLWLGLAHAFRRAPTQGLFLVAYAAFAATALEGLLIDTDHWRHGWVLLGLVWGLIAAHGRGGAGAAVRAAATGATSPAPWHRPSAPPAG